MTCAVEGVQPQPPNSRRMLFFRMILNSRLSPSRGTSSLASAGARLGGIDGRPGTREHDRGERCSVNGRGLMGRQYTKRMGSCCRVHCRRVCPLDPKGSPETATPSYETVESSPFHKGDTPFGSATRFPFPTSHPSSCVEAHIQFPISHFPQPWNWRCGKRERSIKDKGKRSISRGR